MSIRDKEFVCELRFVVQDATKEYSVDDLRNWLRKALVVDLNMEEAGMFHYDPDEDQSACVSASSFLNTLSEINHFDLPQIM